MGTQEVDVLARLSPEGQPLLGDCTLITGLGTAIFKNGRSRVPIEVARALRARDDIEVPVLADEPTPVGTTSDDGPTAEERIADLERQLAEAKAAKHPDVNQTKPPEVDEAARAEQVRLAQEHLASEGEHVPDPEDDNRSIGKITQDEVDSIDNAERGPVPAGFENQTAEGELRCLASKGDDSQCKNAAADGGNACGLAPHQAQFS